jgi:hypothetical protein
VYTFHGGGLNLKGADSMRKYQEVIDMILEGYDYNDSYQVLRNNFMDELYEMADEKGISFDWAADELMEEIVLEVERLQD